MGIREGLLVVIAAPPKRVEIEAIEMRVFIRFRGPALLPLDSRGCGVSLGRLAFVPSPFGGLRDGHAVVGVRVMR